MPAEYEAEVIPGIEPFTIDELNAKFGGKINDIRCTRSGFLRFRYDDRSEHFFSLRSVVAIYQIHPFEVPRPKALLGHQHFTRLVGIATAAFKTFGNAPRTFGIGAAGSESSVIRRLKSELERALELAPADDGKGELFLRLMRKRDGNNWEVLVRTTAKPLSKREYRVFDIAGSLNASAAFAMTQIRRLPEHATVVNLCSGSSTILIEHALDHPRHQLIAIDNSQPMLDAGRCNTAASQTADCIHHLLADARQTPLRSSSADLIYADLPFGHHIGTHDENEATYPAILEEAARLACPGVAFVVLSHEINLMHRCLRNSPWEVVSETRINLRGLHPHLFVLKRISGTILVDNRVNL